MASSTRRPEFGADPVESFVGAGSGSDSDGDSDSADAADGWGATGNLGSTFKLRRLFTGAREDITMGKRAGEGRKRGKVREGRYRCSCRQWVSHCQENLKGVERLGWYGAGGWRCGVCMCVYYVFLLCCVVSCVSVCCLCVALCCEMISMVPNPTTVPLWEQPFLRSTHPTHRPMQGNPSTTTKGNTYLVTSHEYIVCCVVVAFVVVVCLVGESL